MQKQKSNISQLKDNQPKCKNIWFCFFVYDFTF